MHAPTPAGAMHQPETASDHPLARTMIARSAALQVILDGETRWADVQNQGCVPSRIQIGVVEFVERKRMKVPRRELERIREAGLEVGLASSTVDGKA
eukprot:1760048-Rhodomonas_salina.3